MNFENLEQIYMVLKLHFIKFKVHGVYICYVDLWRLI